MSFIQAQIKNTRKLLLVNKLTGTVTVMNELLAKNTGGVVIPATSGSVRSELEGVSNQAIAVADALLQVPVIELSSGDTWIADLANNSNAAHNFQRMVLTSSTVVNNTGTDNASGVVEQVEPFGAAADKKAIVRFL